MSGPVKFSRGENMPFPPHQAASDGRVLRSKGLGMADNKGARVVIDGCREWELLLLIWRTIVHKYKKDFTIKGERTMNGKWTHADNRRICWFLLTTPTFWLFINVTAQLIMVSVKVNLRPYKSTLEIPSIWCAAQALFYRTFQEILNGLQKRLIVFLEEILGMTNTK